MVESTRKNHRFEGLGVHDGERRVSRRESLGCGTVVASIDTLIGNGDSLGSQAHDGHPGNSQAKGVWDG